MLYSKFVIALCQILSLVAEVTAHAFSRDTCHDCNHSIFIPQRSQWLLSTEGKMLNIW